MGQSTAIDGPISVLGQRPPMVGTASYTGAVPALLDSNQDLAPSLIWGGIGVRDPRYLPRIGAGPLASGGYANQDCGWYHSGGGLHVVDQVPSVLSTTNIAGAQGVANGTAMTLAAASAGITIVPAGGLSLLLPLGATIPAGAVVLDGNPGYVGGGTSGGFQFFDPTKALSRCVSVTAAGGATGGVFTVRGFDVYGAAMTEAITAAAGTTANGKKAFKFIASITPAVTDAGHNYSVGTLDIFGMPIRADRFPLVRWTWDVTVSTTNTGFTAAVTTTATATTGDVRGTLTPPSASDGTRRLFMSIGPSVANAVGATFALAQSGLVGVSQYAG